MNTPPTEKVPTLTATGPYGIYNKIENRWMFDYWGNAFAFSCKHHAEAQADCEWNKFTVGTGVAYLRKQKFTSFSAVFEVRPFDYCDKKPVGPPNVDIRARDTEK